MALACHGFECQPVVWPWESYVTSLCLLLAPEFTCIDTYPHWHLNHASHHCSKLTISTISKANPRRCDREPFQRQWMDWFIVFLVVIYIDWLAVGPTHRTRVTLFFLVLLRPQLTILSSLCFSFLVTQGSKQILVLRLGIEHVRPAVEARSQPLDRKGSPYCSFFDSFPLGESSVPMQSGWCILPWPSIIFIQVARGCKKLDLDTLIIQICHLVYKMYRCIRWISILEGKFLKNKIQCTYR